MREGLVSWSVETLMLALIVIAILCALYVAFKAFQQSPKWGVVFLAGPGLFWGLSLYTGWLIAGLVVIASQVYYVREPYNWKTWGRIYVYLVLCWAGGTYIHASEHGWLPLWAGGSASPVMQAGRSAATPAQESYLPVEGGRIWYRRTGAGSATPVILLHGGPGMGSFQLKALEALGDERTVVRYDQLGAGRSDRARDTSLFNVPRYVRELDSLRSAMGFEKVHLIGHSWGALLAHEYYRANPARVASLVLSGPILSAPAWIRNTRRLLQALPDSMRQRVTEAESSGDYDSPDYQVAVDDYSARFVWRRPMDSDLDSARRTMGREAYWHMWGPSDFTVTGTLRNYDASRQLRLVRVPVLYTAGQYDEADTATVRRFATLTPGSRFEVVPDAAHTTMWDNPGELLRLVRSFLRAVDAPPPADSTPAAPASTP